MMKVLPAKSRSELWGLHLFPLALKAWEFQKTKTDNDEIPGPDSPKEGGDLGFRVFRDTVVALCQV